MPGDCNRPCRIVGHNELNVLSIAVKSLFMGPGCFIYRRFANSPSLAIAAPAEAVSIQVGAASRGPGVG